MTDQPSGAPDLLSALKETWQASSGTTETASRRRSPVVESLAETVEKSFQGSETRDHAIAAIAQAQERLGATSQDLAHNLSLMTLTPRQQEISDGIRQGYADCATTMNQLQEAVAAEDKAGATRTIESLREISHQLYGHQAEWERETAMDSSGSGAAVLPGEYVRLYEACDRVARGRMTKPEWLAVLEGITSAVHETAAKMEEGLTPYREQLGDEPVLKGVAAEIQAGLVDCISALQEIHAFEDDDDVNHLNQGWTAFVAAFNRIQQGVGRMMASQGSQDDMVILEHDE